MPYATYRFNKIIAAETIRFIVTVAIVVYKGLKLVVYRMLTELDMKEKELSRLARIIDKAFRWFPMFREMLRMEKFCAMLGFSKEMTESLIVKKEALKCSGKIYSEQHRRNFDIKDDILRVENDPDDESRLNLTINRKPIADWFREQWHRLRYGTRSQQEESKYKIKL